MDTDSSIADYIKNFFFAHFSDSECVRLIKVAHQEIEFHFAHPKIEEKYFLALKHLQISKFENRPLQLFVFDLKSLHITSPLTDFIRHFFWQAGHVNNLPPTQDSRPHSHLFYMKEVAYYYNLEHHLALWVDENTEELSPAYWVHPMKFLLYDWLQNQGAQVTHVAAISHQEQAVILAGQSGSGKSTTTISCLGDGFSCLGDDKCVLSLTPEPTVYSLYNSFKLHESALSYFPQFAHTPSLSIQTNLGQKSIFYLENLFPHQIALKKPVKAIIKLSVNKSLTSPKLHDMSHTEAVKHLSLSTIAQCSWINPKTVLKNLHLFAAKVPHIYHLEVCPHFEKNIELLKNVLQT